jgi:putative endonuclease
MWYVYVLLCNDGSLYCGAKNNIEARFKVHLAGKGGAYTRSHKPIRLVFKQELDSKSSALKREIEIKSWSRVDKISRLDLKLA